MPIINGNDVITTLELSSGGNDGLAAIIAIAMDADRLVLMTNTDGVFDKNPFTDPTAKKFHTIKEPDVLLRMINSQTSEVGIGGMYAKVEAARLAWYAGIPTVIANGMNPVTYDCIADDIPPGTVFMPQAVPSRSDKLRSAGFYRHTITGSVVIDAGRRSHQATQSLLVVGIKQVKGEFKVDDIVSIENVAGQLV